MNLSIELEASQKWQLMFEEETESRKQMTKKYSECLSDIRELEKEIDLIKQEKKKLQKDLTQFQQSSAKFEMETMKLRTNFDIADNKQNGL